MRHDLTTSQSIDYHQLIPDTPLSGQLVPVSLDLTPARFDGDVVVDDTPQPHAPSHARNAAFPETPLTVVRELQAVHIQAPDSSPVQVLPAKRRAHELPGEESHRSDAESWVVSNNSSDDGWDPCQFEPMEDCLHGGAATDLDSVSLQCSSRVSDASDSDHDVEADNDDDDASSVHSQVRGQALICTA